MQKQLYSSLFALFLIVSSCSNNNDQYLLSSSFNSKSARIEALERIVKFKSPVENVEFNLFNVNGFNNRVDVPGASSWRYQYAIKVKPVDLEKWLTGTTKHDTKLNTEGWIETVFNKDEWETNSIPVIFFNKDKSVSYMVFQDEGIIVIQTGQL